MNVTLYTCDISAVGRVAFQKIRYLLSHVKLAKGGDDILLYEPKITQWLWEMGFDDKNRNKTEYIVNSLAVGQ